LIEQIISSRQPLPISVLGADDITAALLAMANTGE
jgi:hypothetical protein